MLSLASVHHRGVFNLLMKYKAAVDDAVSDCLGQSSSGMSASLSKRPSPAAVPLSYRNHLSYSVLLFSWINLSSLKW